jgi:hypothetical protein
LNHFGTERGIVMLHLEFVDDIDFYEKNAFTMHDETFFRMELCSDMENYYEFGANQKKEYLINKSNS